MPSVIGGAILGAGAIAGGASILGSSQASSSADRSADIQKQQQAQTRADQLPFIVRGQQAYADQFSDIQNGVYNDRSNAYIDQANNFLAASQGYADIAQADSTAAQRLGQGPEGQAQLEALPGYQFTLAQGLQANQNAMAARGLGVSGAAMKGAATFATGLANSTYGDQFNRLMQGANFVAGTGQTYAGLGRDSLNLNNAFQGNLTNRFNRSLATSGLGEDAAANTGNTGQLAASAQGNFINAAGQASAAGDVGVGKAVTGGVNNFLTQNQLAQQTAILQANQGGINGAAGVNGLTTTDPISGNTTFI